jgi:hypothetical protein
MTAPGITVTSLASPPPVTTVAPTAPWFVTGITQRGRTDAPISVTSMGEVNEKLGVRNGNSALWDALDLFFRDGGVQAWVARVAGPAATVATLAIKDGASTPLTTLTVNANSPGAWANGATGGLTVAVVAGSVAGTYQLVISLGGVVVETTPNLTTPADAAAWSATSKYVTILDAHSATVAPQNNPAVAAAAPLAGGTDDNASIVEATWTAALDRFSPDLGPGQVSAPGRTTDAAHIALLAHAAANNRIALLDGADTGTAATLITEASAVVAAGGDPSRGAIFAPWVVIPGLPTGGPVPAAPRTVAPSALAAAAIARTDAATGNPNVAAAGTPEGVSSFAIGVSQTFNAADRGALNSVGVDVIRNIAGVVQVYGFRTLSNDPNWVQLNWARLRMAIQEDGTKIAAGIAQFAQLDGKGQMLGRLNGHLAGMLQAYWQKGALYGNVASEAFAVDTSPAVNTPATLAAGQVIAVLSIRRTPMAEFTQIEIVNVPITQPV